MVLVSLCGRTRAEEEERKVRGEGRKRARMHVRTTASLRVEERMVSVRPEKV